MITVAADTNIYISAIVFGGPPRDFLEIARTRAGLLDLATSAPLVDEIQRLRRKFDWSDVMVADACERLCHFTRQVIPARRSRSCRTIRPTIACWNVH